MRNLSPYEAFLAAARERPQQHSFRHSGITDVAAWQTRTMPAVRATLGRMPDFVPSRPELVADWQQDGLRKQKWLIDVDPHLSAAAYVNLPGDLTADERRAGILCWHGHGSSAAAVMGNAPERGPNNQYGHVMAKAGFVTFAIDWIGAGERSDDAKPNHRPLAGGRDWCNLYYLHATMLGMTPLGISIAHGHALTEFVSSLPPVDGDRLGVMGLSGGGTLALWSAICDPRLRAIEIICYSDLFAHFGFRDSNYCGLQIAPGLAELVDVPDLQGLLVPRPLLVDIGVHDRCFLVESALACHEQVREIYEAAGAIDRLQLNLFPGDHRWDEKVSPTFFTTWLDAVV